MDRVFVYGTLKRGHPNHDVVAQWVSAAESASLSGYALYDCGDYPAIWPEPGRRVRGELLTLGDASAALAELDDYEGDEYRRVGVNVQTSDASHAAWTYVLAEEPREAWRPLEGESWDPRGKRRLER